MLFTEWVEPIVPWSIRFASGLIRALGIYGLAMGLFGLPTGLFVGPHILIPVLIHIALGWFLLVARGGLRRRERWVLAVLLLISIVVTIGLPALMLREWSVRGENPEGVMPWLVIPVLFAAVASSLLTKSAWQWFGIVTADDRAGSEPPARSG